MVVVVVVGEKGEMREIEYMVVVVVIAAVVEKA